MFMINLGRESLGQSRAPELNLQLAREGTQVRNIVAKREIEHVGTLLPEIDNTLRDAWEGKFDAPYEAFNAMAIEIKAKPELGGFIDQVAPEAVSMMVAAYGKEWWKGVDSEDLLFVQDVAENNNRRDRLANHIMEQLDFSKEGVPTLKTGHENKLRLLHTVLGYDDARSDSRLTLRYFAERMKFKNKSSNPHVVLDKMGVATDRARKMFEWQAEATSEEGLNRELNTIFSAILNNANMLGDEGRGRLTDRLGIVMAEDGSWAFDRKSQSKTDGERAMFMVVNQRLRNKGIRSNNQKLKEVFKQDGPSKTELMKHGMDELVLDLFMQETAQDCGRVFQERIRREIIKERINEFRFLNENRTAQTISDEQVFRGIVRATVEIVDFAQDVAGMLERATNSVIDRVKPGGFLSKVLGTMKSGLGLVQRAARNFTNEIPSDVPDFERRLQKRASVIMPDLFAEFEG